MLYDVTAHPALSEKAKALLVRDAAAFAAQVLLAETQLGVPEAALAGRRGEQMALAVALQVDFQVETGIDPLYQAVAASSHTKQAVTYRDRTVDPRAQRLVDAARDDGTGVGAYTGELRSLRSQSLA